MRPTDEQQEIVDVVHGGSDTVIEAGAGCLAADTTINVNRGGVGGNYTGYGKGSKVPIEHVARQVAGNPVMTVTKYGKTFVQRARQWDLSIPTYVARADGDVSRLGVMSSAWFSGVKETFEVVTESDRKIRATATHPFLVDGGVWATLEELVAGNRVCVSTGRSAREHQPKLQYRSVHTCFHPYQVNASNTRVRFKVPLHRAIIEAEINGLSLECFIEILRTDAERSASLHFLGREWHVHHKDRNSLNNERSNLQLMTEAEHHALHSRDGTKNHVLWQIGSERVVSIKYHGEEPTFDVEVADDPHNFLANGFVVHNTGKTSTLKLIAANEAGRSGMCVYFNKAPADEARRTLPSNVSASTAHKLAFDAMRGRPFMARLDGPMVTPRQLAEDFLGIKNWFTDVPKGRKPVSSWKIASMAVGAVKRFCYTDAEKIEPWHVERLEGIVGEHEKALRKTVLPLAREIWDDLQRADGWAQFTPDHFMKIWALEDPQLDADFIMVDECFPAGTLVDTHIGEVPIERITSEPDRDWQVLSSVDGGKTLTWSNVNSAYKTPRRNRLVRIYHEHGSLICTANHPVWVVRSDGDGGTSGAWTPAGLVREGDSVPCLRRADGQGESDVFADMLANDRVARALVGIGSAEAGEDLAQDEGRAYRDSEPYARPGRAAEGVAIAASDGSQAAGAGRERSRADRVRGSALYGVDEDLRSAAMEPRSCRRVWSTTAWPTDPLQDRRRVLEDDDRGRGGRLIPLVSVATRSRSSQRRVPVLARVDRVALLESGRAGEGDDDRAGDHVYTLSVEDGSYFADGVLVKNCQDTNGVLAGILRRQDHMQRVLVGDSCQRLFSWRGSVDMMAEFGARAEVRYLTQSFRFGDAVAEEANRWLEYLDASLRLRGLPSINSRLGALERPDAILCRTNADTIEQAMDGQERGFDVAIVGDRLVEQIVSFASAAAELKRGEKVRHRDLSQFKSWGDVVEFVDDGDADANFATSVRLIQRYGAGTVQRVCLSCVPARDADFVISTVHKVKGMEWPTVYLDAGLMPDEAAEEAGEISKSELMVGYVAATRAREVLDVTAIEPFHQRRRRRREMASSGRPA